MFTICMFLFVNSCLTPRFAEEQQPSAVCGAVIFIKKFSLVCFMVNKISLYRYICTCYKDFHKNFSIKVHYLYIFIYQLLLDTKVRGRTTALCRMWCGDFHKKVFISFFYA